jgi:hypothetical protein
MVIQPSRSKLSNQADGAIMQLALALAHNPENNEKIIEVGLTPLRLPFFAV